MAYLMVLTMRMILQTKSCMYSNEVHRKTHMRGFHYLIFIIINYGIIISLFIFIISSSHYLLAFLLSLAILSHHLIIIISLFIIISYFIFITIIL